MKHIHTSVVRAVAAVSLLMGVNVSPAAPVFYPATGHWYDAIPSVAISWDEAKVAAEVLGGHLATINTTAENDFIFANLPAASAEFFGYWLGGFQPGDTPDPDADPAAGWEWVTGEVFDASFWSVFGGPHGEPNDCECLDYKEDALHLWANVGGWNDLPRERKAEVNGFVVEYDRNPNAVPDSPLGLWPAVCLILLLGISAKRKRIFVVCLGLVLLWERPARAVVAISNLDNAITGGAAVVFINDTDHIHDIHGTDAAQSFKTGTGSFHLMGVSVSIDGGQDNGLGDVFAISLHGDNDGVPGTLLASLVGDGTPNSPGIYSYTVSGYLPLLSDTWYWIVASVPQSGGSKGYTFNGTHDLSETGLSGWELGVGADRWNDNGVPRNWAPYTDFAHFLRVDISLVPDSSLGFWPAVCLMLVLGASARNKSRLPQSAP